jgi:hypothetical protein
MTLTPKALHTGRTRAEADIVGTPVALDDDPLTRRILRAYAAYDAAYKDARPGTSAGTRLAKARLDLALALEDAGVELPALVQVQLNRDADELVRTTPVLTEA